jgi:hypothetical protein
VESTDFQGSIIHLPNAIVDLLQPNILPGTNGGDLDPIRLPTHPSTGIDVTDLETIWVFEWQYFPWHCTRGGGIDRSRRLLVESFVRTHIVELIAEMVEATLLSGHAAGRRPSRLGFEGSMHAFVPAVLLRLTGLYELGKDS